MGFRFPESLNGSGLQHQELYSGVHQKSSGEKISEGSPFHHPGPGALDHWLQECWLAMTVNLASHVLHSWWNRHVISLSLFLSPSPLPSLPSSSFASSLLWRQKRIICIFSSMLICIFSSMEAELVVHTPMMLTIRTTKMIDVKSKIAVTSA